MDPLDTSGKVNIDRHTLDEAAVKWETTRVEDIVAVEEPLEIRVEGKPVAVVMRTPGHDEALTAGFLVTENVVKNRRDIFELSQCPSTALNHDGTPAGNTIDVVLTDASSFNLDALTRNVFSSSSCGVCGKATIESILIDFPRIDHLPEIDPDVIHSLPEKLRAGQSTFDETGGLHACGIFDSTGELVVLREDVGRHNAVDKTIGHLIMRDKLPAADHIMLVSGRISFEIMQKALAAGVPTVAGISAPTSLAVRFARESGQQLIGFLRDRKFNIYDGT